MEVLGSASPNTFAQEQNILLFVFSWTWISSPMTGTNSIEEPYHIYKQQNLDCHDAAPREQRSFAGQGRLQELSSYKNIALFILVWQTDSVFV